MHNLENKRILITGGAGFVGSHTLEQLLDEGIKETIIIDNLVRGSEDNIKDTIRSGRVKFIEGDIRDVALLNKLFPGIDYCFHMAALRITRCVDDPGEAIDVMLKGTFNIIQACVKHKVTKLITASSASVYGAAETFPTKETHHPYNNRTLYGAAKLTNELMCRAFNSMCGLDYVAMRYFNIYGPRMDIEGKYTEVLIRWYYSIKQGEQPLIFGDGKQTMDFVYVEDVANSNILAMKSNVTDDVLNIAGGTETSLEELCMLLLEVMGSDIKPRFLPLPDERRDVEVKRRLADVSKARQLIGFDARISLREGLEELVNWLDKVTTERLLQHDSYS